MEVNIGGQRKAAYNISHFRTTHECDDTKQTRTVTLYQQDISLDLLEESIQNF